jgi:hypothetical protein
MRKLFSCTKSLKKYIIKYHVDIIKEFAYMTILIITHNQKKQTIACIESIQKFYDIDNVAIVVIDNYSDDGNKHHLS